MTDRHNLIAFVSCIFAILILALSAVAITLWSKVTGPELAAALAGLGGAITGLVGIAGTFKGRQNGMSEATSKEIIHKIPPTEGES